MSRIDKSQSAIGNFRAPLNVALTATSGPGSVTDLNRILVVALNSSGRVIKATTALAAVGIIIATKPMAVGDPIDVFTAGEAVELDGADIQGGVAATAGQKLYLDTTASRLANVAAPTAGTNYFYVGTLIEATRLAIRTQLMQGGV